MLPSDGASKRRFSLSRRRDGVTPWLVQLLEETWGSNAMVLVEQPDFATL
jgi:hypothetical protein